MASPRPARIGAETTEITNISATLMANTRTLAHGTHNGAPPARKVTFRG